MKIELRSDSVFISGYVNAVGRDSRPIVSPNGKFVEMIEPGTFNEALTRAQNVDLLLNHNKMRKLGSISDGNLTLTEDSIGLRAECEIKDAEVIEKARNKQLRGWSFGMYVNNAEMENRAENVPRRHIRALDLFEVSIIDNQMLPCYAGTSVECRADGDVMSEMRATDDETEEITEVKAAEPADYSRWEKRAAELANAPYEKRLEELRYNPYHDPTNGRFTSGSGGGMGFLFVGKGQKGKGAYVIPSEEFKHSGTGADIERSENIKREFLDSGLSSNIAGIRKKAEEGTGNYSFKNASAVSSEDAEKFVTNGESIAIERKGKTLIQGYTDNGKDVFYANDSSSPEIQNLMKIRNSKNIQDTSLYQHDFMSGTGMGFTSTYNNTRNRRNKKFDDWYGAAPRASRAIPDLEYFEQRAKELESGSYG